MSRIGYIVNQASVHDPGDELTASTGLSKLQSLDIFASNPAFIFARFQTSNRLNGFSLVAFGFLDLECTQHEPEHHNYKNTIAATHIVRYIRQKFIHGG